MKDEWIGVRTTKPLKDLIKRVADARGETVSSFILRSTKIELARLGYLSEEEKKALGMLNELGRIEELTV